MTTTTKKMLCAVKIGEITMRKGGFVIPSQDEGFSHLFTAIDGGGIASFACIAYTGRDLNAETLLERYRDSGAEIEDEELVLSEFDDFLSQIKSFRVGNVLGIRGTKDKRELYLAHKSPPEGTY
ncbi:MAG: hypothetical protein AAF664_07250 [Planctomycetota bacterium]